MSDFNETAPVFIVGVPRSGTTLLGEILNRHSRICISPESHYYLRFAPSLQEPQDRDVGAVETFTREILNSAEFNHFGFDPDNVESVVQSVRTSWIDRPSHGTVLGAILRSYANLQRKEIMGEKTPGHIQFVRQIVRDFPNAKIVAIHRDPRDVSLSIGKVPWSRGNCVFHARLWVRLISAWDAFVQAAPGSTYEIKYEELVARPVETIRPLCGFLGVDYQSGMLETQTQSRPLFSCVEEPWKEGASGAISTRSVGKWRKEMRRCERDVIESITKEVMVRKGYRPVGHSTSIAGPVCKVWMQLHNLGSLAFSRVRKWHLR